MAYNSAYLSGPIYFGGKGAPSLWVYDDTASAATVIVSGYISDGYQRGMEQGDFILYRKFTSLSAKSSPTVSLHYVTVVTSAEDTTLSAAIGDTSGLTVPVVSGTTTPAATDDTNSGYTPGSLWVETDVDEVYANVDATSGAAIWYPLSDHFMLTYNGINLDADGTLGDIALPLPVPADLVSAYSVLAGSGTSLSATCSIVLSRNATAITDGTITIANAATGADVDVATPSALNTFAAGDVLNGAVSTTQTSAQTANFVAYFRRLSS